MINIVIPVIDKPEEYTKAIASVFIKQDVNILVGVVESIEDKLQLPASVVVKVYKNGSKKEEIINALKDYLQEGKVIVCRRPFTKKEFDLIANSDADITYFEKPIKNKFKDFCKRAMGKLIKTLFGVKFFDGDVSLIGFGEDMSEVLQNVSSLSYSSRVDRWRGVEHKKVLAEKAPVALESSNIKNVSLIIYSVLCLLVPIAVTVLVAIFTKVSFIIGMLLFCINVFGIVGLVLLVCSYVFIKNVGQRYFPNALESNKN